MSDSRKKLERAFKLIKRDKTDEALRIVRPILQAEPQNVDAWWLLAYAATEPAEVRQALLTVLRLDPEYSNAPKAREMLARLNEEYPPSQEEIAQFPELETSFFPSVFDTDSAFFEDSVSGFESQFAETEPGEPFPDAFGDVFTGSELPEEDIFASGSSFATSRFDVADKPPSLPPAASRPAEDIRAAIRHEGEVAVDELFSAEGLDDETLAALEEKAGRNARRSPRALRIAGFILVVLAALVGVIVVLRLGGGDSGEADLGQLEVISLDSQPVIAAQAAAESELNTANLGAEGRVVLARSALEETLFVEFCAFPGPDLPELIVDAMELAARQVPSLQDNVKAVGVNVQTCGGEPRDTLYRAVVSTADALRYLNAEITLEAFQALWKTS